MLLRRARATSAPTAIVVSIALAAAAVVIAREPPQSPVNRPWPPAVQDTGRESPPLSPDAALKTFHLPPGYRLELVASEPLVQDPVMIDWDPAGRLWVVETPGYMRSISGADEHAPSGRVVVLEDRDGDGLMDRRTVFADGLVMPRAVKVLDQGVLVGEPPNVWLMRDADDDLRMDTKTLVTDRYGRREIDPQNNANSLYWAMDNRIHTAGQSDTLLRPARDAGRAFDVARAPIHGQWGVTQDDAGRLFRNTNESALHVDVLPAVYYARHPSLLRTRGLYERLADDNPDLNIVWPARPTPAANRAYQSGVLREDGTLARYTAVCAPLVYRGDRLPADLYGNVFVAEPAANVVSRIIVDDDDGGVRARKAYERGEIVASTDERFRPVHLSNAPDGTLYIVDLYRGILEHRLSMTEYLRDQIVARRLEQPIGMGRIYRLVHESARRDARRLDATTTTSALVELLSHPNGWWRDTAERLIVERRQAIAGTPAARALARLATSAPDWRTRLQALWTLDGIDDVDVALVTRALEDPSREVRAAGIRVAERWLGEDGHPVLAAVLARRLDADAAVRRQLAASLGALPVAVRVTALTSLLEAHGDDRITMDAAISGLYGVEMVVLDKLMSAGNADGPTPRREASIAMLAATVVRGGDAAAAQRLLSWIGDERHASWRRAAVLNGAEVALLGTAMPGTPVPRGGSATSPPAPCPTCPGARGGPGGAYAYMRPTVVASLNGGGRGSGTTLRLEGEPRALTGLSSTDPLAPRVARVLERVSWPGKPGEAAPAAPLTAAEQRRFDAGGAIYRNVCQACHQPDGRGQDKLAPSLVGSAWTLGPSDVAARILLHGKEGRIGLMPPVGSTLTDAQLAEVLTYVRRAWGQAAAPVDAATISSIRARTKDRTRPWTDDELKVIAGAKPR